MSDFDIQNFMPYLLNQAAEATSREFQRYYRDNYGLLRTDWRVLFHLGRYGALSATEIGQRAGEHKTKISRAVQRLADLRMLEKEADPTDRRSEILRLSPRGRHAFADLEKQALAYDTQLLKPLNENEKHLLRGLLRRLSKVDTG